MGTAKFEGLGLSRYEDIRDELRTGDLVFCAGNYAISRIIQHFSDSMFSHVGLVYCWNDRVLVFESVEDDGVRLVPLSQYVRDYENSGAAYDGRVFIGRHDEPLAPEQVLALLGRAADELNRRYDKEEMLEILARVTIGLGKHQDDDAYVCSEYVERCFREVGIVFDRDAQDYIFPEHIAADPSVQALWEIQPE
ncbi:MAG TPA: YiiX/YebB-like N1pC/P60 family cysteine hydrolase [Burkholderiales bacterium]|nr:YiiX/YebB-like N1pC/P60 family cysteine hydrolase [Burkholderiales bacterium]